MDLSFATAARGARAALGDAVRVALNLYRVMIPIVIGVKILVELDLIRWAALPLKPFMSMMGLPADLGLAWAFAIIVNVYAALIVLAGMLPNLPPLTAAQATTFAVIVLIAHGLILESRIAAQCGVSFTGQFLLRLGGALLCGMLMHLFYDAAGFLQEPAPVLLPAPGPDPTLLQWAGGEALNLFYIFWIIAGLMLMQRALAHCGIERLLGRVLSPLLIFLGISPKAATCIVVGFSMGLLYGSGILIRESREGGLTPRDVFCAVTLIGLAHALIEDTLLMMLIGGHISGLLGMRLVFALLFSLCVTRIFDFFTTRRAAGSA